MVDFFKHTCRTLINYPESLALIEFQFYDRTCWYIFTYKYVGLSILCCPNVAASVQESIIFMKYHFIGLICSVLDIANLTTAFMKSVAIDLV